MGLNIKNEETNRLVDELAAATGESKTTAIKRAVQERLARLKQEQQGSLAQRLLTIGERCARRIQEPFLSAEHGDLLYDEKGLPR